MKRQSTGISYKKLISIAHNAKHYSYSPYSKFRVGAALLDSNGKIYTGCNIENSSYGLTICAERTAVFKAISEGAKKFRAIAVVSDNGYTPPCGACRQVLMDLASNIDLVMGGQRGKFKVIKLVDLLPFPFKHDKSHKIKSKK
jgi:cytidine deaminase